MSKPTPQPGILNIAPYVGGKSRLEGVRDVIKLSSNENPLGPSPKVIKAVHTAAPGLHRYPSTDHADLRAALADLHGLQADRIICGVGSDEVLQFICQSYAGPGEEVIYTEHGFSMYPILAHAVGATPVQVAERDRVVDVEAILAAVTGKTRIVFIANPANPTGTMIDLATVTRLADGLPEQVILVLDGAYVEFTPDYDGGTQLAQTRPNVIMTRTFSKIYGLGGMRVGWAYGAAEIIAVLNRIRQPFNLSTVALEAALAAVSDQAYIDHCRAENMRLRHWLAEALARLGVASDPSHANFILARFSDQTEAEACDLFLQSRGIIVRRVAGYGLPSALRITVGDDASCHLVADAVAAFKSGGS